MIPSLLALCVAATALIACAASAGVGASLPLLSRALDRSAPAAQARVVLCLALLPAFACAAVMSAALAPSFGWIADHCTVFEALHEHPHLCAHHEPGLPALPLLAIAVLFLGRLAVSALALGRSAVLSARTNHRLARVAASHAGSARILRILRILPFDAPQAFVIGFLRPRLYVTRGLLSDAHHEHVAAVLAHELAHVRRADPLRMLLANAALVFHWPGVAAALRRRLLRAQEMAADADAAVAVGSRARVARALVALARAQRGLPGLTFAFGASNVEARVQKLLDDGVEHDSPKRSTLLLLTLASLAAVALHADALHHGIEHVLGLLSG